MNCVIPKGVVEYTYLAPLMAYQASRSWSPNKNRMRDACEDRLRDAHTPDYQCPLAVERSVERMRDGLMSGDLLITFDT